MDSIYKIQAKLMARSQLGNLIWEGGIPLKSPKCPFKNDYLNFIESRSKKLIVLEWNNPNSMIE